MVGSPSAKVLHNRIRKQKRKIEKSKLRAEAKAANFNQEAELKEKSILYYRERE